MARPVIWMPREAWADLSRPRLGHYVEPEKRTEIFIHHTVTVDSDDTPSVWETYEEVRHHMRHLQTVRPDLWRSWGDVDVPYNVVAFIMRGNGGGHPRLLLAEGVGLHRVGAHSGGRNTRALGVAFAGNFETSDPWQLNHLLGGFGTSRPLSSWIADLKSHLGFANLLESRPPGDDSGDMAVRERRVWAHSDIKATACPGKHLKNKLWMI